MTDQAAKAAKPTNTDTTTKRKKGGRRSADVAEQTKRQILDAALYCFANQGYTTTSLRDIAERAGITHGLPRHHFGSKEELWKACVASLVQHATQRQLPALASATPENALDTFKEVVRLFAANAAEHPDFWRLVTFEAIKDSERLDYILSLVIPQHARVAELFAMVQEAGHLRRFNNDSFFLFLVCLGALPFALSPFNERLAGVDILEPAARDAHIELMLETLFS